MEKLLSSRKDSIALAKRLSIEQNKTFYAYVITYGFLVTDREDKSRRSNLIFQS